MSAFALAMVAVSALLVVGAAPGPSARPLGGRPRPEARSERFVRRLEGRLPSLARITDREVSFALGVSVGGGLLVPPLLVLGPVGLVGLAVQRERRAKAIRGRELTNTLPEMIDLLGVAVGAGLSLPAALDTVQPWLSRELGAVVRATLDRLAAGAPLADALRHLRDELPAPARRPMVVLLAATRDGAPLGTSLERAAAEARLARRRAAETRARRLPVLMLLPLVLCVLPAFVLLTLVPLIVGSLDGLSIGDVLAGP